MKKTKKGIEISHWKVGGTDAFTSITPGWTNEELDIGPYQKEEYYDDEQINVTLAHKNKPIGYK
jgi:hypothetical protein